MNAFKTGFYSVVLLLFVCSISSTSHGQMPLQRAETLQRYGIDPTSSLESRIGPPSPRFIKMFTDEGAPRPTAHDLTPEERRQVLAAFSALTPLHRRVLSTRLRSISFADGMPNTALTVTVNPGEPYEVFDIIFRAGILQENISEILTQKERTCFDAAGSAMNVYIDGGKLDAIIYALLHEATHVVDGSLGMIKDSNSIPAGSNGGPFTSGVWSDRTTPVPQYRTALLEDIHYRGGKIRNMNEAQNIYDALRKTPFVSLYGSSNWYDDLAELVTWYHLTQKMKQPYHLEIRRGAEVLYSYSPMDSTLVQSRFEQITQFYAE